MLPEGESLPLPDMANLVHLSPFEIMVSLFASTLKTVFNNPLLARL